MSRIVLLWAQSRRPPDVVGALESGAFDRFTLLAPVLDAQVQAEEAAAGSVPSSPPSTRPSC